MKQKQLNAVIVVQFAVGCVAPAAHDYAHTQLERAIKIEQNLADNYTDSFATVGVALIKKHILSAYQ